MGWSCFTHGLQSSSAQNTHFMGAAQEAVWCPTVHVWQRARQGAEVGRYRHSGMVEHCSGQECVERHN